MMKGYEVIHAPFALGATRHSCPATASYLPLLTNSAFPKAYSTLLLTVSTFTKAYYRVVLTHSANAKANSTSNKAYCATTTTSYRRAACRCAPST